MRLYLSSHRLGERAGSLIAMLGGARGARAAVIANGLDGASSMARKIYLSEVFDPIAELGSLGISAEELDLRAYFGSPAALRNRLRSFDLVWVMGGNSFILRRAMEQSRFDRVIEDMLASDAIIYGGEGAGAVVAGPNLMGFELAHDPWDIPESYDESVVWNGLSLVPFTIVPHFRSNHPDSAVAEKLVNYLRARRLPYRALCDGEVVVTTSAREADRPLLKRIA